MAAWPRPRWDGHGRPKISRLLAAVLGRASKFTSSQAQYVFEQDLTKRRPEKLNIKGEGVKAEDIPDAGTYTVGLSEEGNKHAWNGVETRRGAAASWRCARRTDGTHEQTGREESRIHNPVG
ncbi:hypothetical protein CLCR_09289 [Cladophialophora carrionii]|uniref:Uncharacterized protein n=1 Tax=Cladophialophora carrionii TaxID=86049 RepID=A0A1C1CUA9_9EURO|nr:hypothetical protein CLCR_09289 [Cladophialophora carrionii]